MALKLLKICTEPLKTWVRSERPYVERGGPCLLLKLRRMGTQRGQMKGVLSWPVPWACRAGTRDFCSPLASLVGPLQNIFFLTIQYFNSFVPIPSPSKLGRQPCWVACLSLCVSGKTPPPPLQIGYDTKRCYATFLIQWQNIRELSKFSPVFTTPDKFY